MARSLLIEFIGGQPGAMLRDQFATRDERDSPDSRVVGRTNAQELGSKAIAKARTSKLRPVAPRSGRVFYVTAPRAGSS